MLKVIDRLIDNSRKKENGCIEWTLSRTPKGYGRIRVRGVTQHAHRVAYREFIGEIPNGLSVLHHCDNPPCINPAHLFLGTNLDNRADSTKKGRPAHAECHWNSKLTEHQVRTIRWLWSVGYPQKIIGKAFGISKSTVGNIVRWETWTREALCQN